MTNIYHTKRMNIPYIVNNNNPSKLKVEQCNSSKLIILTKLKFRADLEKMYCHFSYVY